MTAFRRSLSCALLLSLGALAGCQLFSADAWQRPSPLSGRPPPPERQEKHESQGGFTVLVDAPGQPTAARAATDIGAFAQGRGFVRQSAGLAAERYVLGNIVLDVAYQSAEHHVSASLHSFSSGLNRKFADGFYHGFDQEYAGRYGDEDPIVENDYVDGSGSLFGSGGVPGRNGR